MIGYIITMWGNRMVLVNYHEDNAFDNFSNEEVATCWYWIFSLGTQYNDDEFHESQMYLLEQTSQIFSTFLDFYEEFKASTGVGEHNRNIMAIWIIGK